MFSVESIKDYLHGLNQREMLRAMAMYLICFSLIIGYLLFRHVNLFNEIEQRTKVLNKARQDIQSILTEYDQVKSKKKEVDQILTTDKNFYLVKYYQDTIQASSIVNKTSSNLSTQAGPAGYDEESLQINFTQITMKQLCEFLQNIQANNRVVVKNLDITKGPVPKKINAGLTIATLKPSAEKTNSAR